MSPDKATSRDEQLIRELTEANRRLSGTLRIVLEALDARDVRVLFGRVLEELHQTFDADSAVAYLAESDGFRLRSATSDVQGSRLPAFLPIGEGVQARAVSSGQTLLLQLQDPDIDELRRGALESRVLLEEASGELVRTSSATLLPFSSFLAVPVFFGDHVIALVFVGWFRPRVLRADDARLLDAVARYLSVQLMGALTSMRTSKRNSLERKALQLRDALGAAELTRGSLAGMLDELSETLSCTCALVRENPHDEHMVVCELPSAGSSVAPAPFDELLSSRGTRGPLRPVRAGDDVSAWLASLGEPDTGVICDLGEIEGERVALLVMRPSAEAPLDDIDLAFLRRVAEDVRQLEIGEAARSQDKRISQALQAGMRSQLQDVEGITARGVYSSATADAFVGGDFYDLIRLPERRACVIMGDVSGKGVEAASVSAAVRTALGAYAWVGLSPADMVRSLNHFLLGFSRVETFATLFVGVVDLAAAELTYCSAGHPPALMLRAGGSELETLDVQSGVVGAFEGMAYRDGHARLTPGDALLLYTDGVTEARDPDGAFFDESGLREAVLREAPAGAEQLPERLLAVLDNFTARSLEDDVAIVSLRFDELG